MIGFARRILGLAGLALPLGAGCSSEGSTSEPLGLDTSAATSTADLLDWLIQDTCVADATLDPYTCAGGHRDLRPGERFYYDRQDQLANQIRNSFPAPLDGEVIVNSFDFGPFNSWTPGDDGYDVIETSPPYASIIDTRDPGGAGVFVHVANGQCELNDSWILFPTAGYLSAGSVVAQLNGWSWERAAEARPGTCPGGNVSAFTPWSRTNVTYSNGKVIDTITSNHHDHSTIAASHASEKFYFTRMYGLTRWESWVADPDGTVGTIGDASCNGSKRVAGWTMRDCRDWTVVVPYPPGNDPAQWPAPVPSRATSTFEAEGTAVSHQVGRADADGWSAATASDSPGYLQYGPYTTGVSLAENTASFSLLVDNNSADNLRVVNLDVYDATGHVVRAARPVDRQEFQSPWTYQDFDVRFLGSKPPNHLFEFRVWWDDHSYVRLDRVRVGMPRDLWGIAMSPLTFEAESGFHQIGRPDADGWSAATAVDAPGYLLYGPYTDQARPGARTATFRLMVDNTTADNLRVASLDVYDATAGVIRAQLDVRRQDLGTPFVYKDFRLNFNAVGGNLHELRVFWYRTSYVRVDRTVLN